MYVYISSNLENKKRTENFKIVMLNSLQSEHFETCIFKVPCLYANKSRGYHSLLGSTRIDPLKKF